jgi:hypothetical protein
LVTNDSAVHFNGSVSAIPGHVFGASGFWQCAASGWIVEENGMQDLRKLLIGSWKSDKRKTLAACHSYHSLEGEKKRKFGALFGNLVLRYTPSRLHFLLRGTQWTAKYEVVATDAESIVLRIHSDDLWKQACPLTADIVKEMMASARLEHIHFRRLNGRQYYWVGFATYGEWFRRQDVRQHLSRQARARFRGRKVKRLLGRV